MTTAIAVVNSQTSTTQAATVDGAAAHAIPTLDGFGLFVLAALLGVGVVWFRRRRQ